MTLAEELRGYRPDKDAKLNLFRLSFDDGQAYEFHRE